MDMAVEKLRYTVDDVWHMQCQAGWDEKHYELIEGELLEMAPANMRHGMLASLMSHYLSSFVLRADAGLVVTEVGFFPSSDRHTLLAPDVAFVSKARLPDPIPETFAGFMPDLAVEVASPGNRGPSLHDKAGIYLRNGTRLVWLIWPGREAAEVCRLEPRWRDSGRFPGRR